MISVGTVVRHKRQSEYIGKVTRVYNVTAVQARSNGAGKNPFTMFHVKWDGNPTSIPMAIHIDYAIGYLESDLTLTK